MYKYDLSILICSLHNRLHLLYKLCNEINAQSIHQSVQFLYLGDNKSMSVGAKRNKLIDIADGRYITFIDDDDMIRPEYIKSILEAIKLSPEVITFYVEKWFNENKDRPQRFSKTYGRNHREPDKSFNNMLPNHLCVWRRDVVKERFPDKNLGEDHIFADLMTQHYTVEHHLNKYLYTYQFNKNITETQKR